MLKDCDWSRYWLDVGIWLWYQKRWSRWHGVMVKAELLLIASFEYTIVNHIESRKLWSIQLYVVRTLLLCSTTLFHKKWISYTFPKKLKAATVATVKLKRLLWIACDHHVCMSINLTGDLTKPMSYIMWVMAVRLISRYCEQHLHKQCFWLLWWLVYTS